jgi:iron complex transport system permease protein
MTNVPVPQLEGVPAVAVASGERGAVIALRRPKLRVWPVVGGLVAVVVAIVLGVCIGPARLPVLDVAKELVGMRSGLGTSSAIVWQLRFPRVILALLVGGVLSMAGGAYQGAFRNQLADPYLLGVASGAGLGATLAIVSSDSSGLVPVAAFIGAILAVAVTYVLSSGDNVRSSSTLILGGVAVSSLFTALQTFVAQRNSNDIRQIYSWILGRLSTSGWTEVLLLLPYAVVSGVVLLVMARRLDVLAVGDTEAQSLGLSPTRTRLVIVLAASLATAAAVSVSGLIAFVGLIVPHAVRLIAGSSNRTILPLSFLYGGVFLALADLVARTVMSPAEIPIGVVTAFLGGPFFLYILRSQRRGS